MKKQKRKEEKRWSIMDFVEIKSVGGKNKQISMASSGHQHIILGILLIKFINSKPFQKEFQRLTGKRTLLISISSIILSVDQVEIIKRIKAIVSDFKMN